MYKWVIGPLPMFLARPIWRERKRFVGSNFQSSRTTSGRTLSRRFRRWMRNTRNAVAAENDAASADQIEGQIGVSGIDQSVYHRSHKTRKSPATSRTFTPVSRLVFPRSGGDAGSRTEPSA